jgi:hypothetical protein
MHEPSDRTVAQSHFTALLRDDFLLGAMRQFASNVRYFAFIVGRAAWRRRDATAILRLIASEDLSVKQATISVANDFLNICISIIPEWLLIYVTKI